MNHSPSLPCAGLAGLALLALAGCNSVSVDTLKPADAQHWLQETCGLQLVRPLKLVDGSWMKASGSQGWHTRVTVNLHIEADEVDAIVRQLRDNKNLQQRGANATHYSFESLYQDHAERACELDAASGKLYFQYVD